ncbi:MAG: antibiotic biosynthesis monooxygenase [Abitibacteriaceae bacterium]|nr:antibiotic biosynthesis monooxygenase [Abditibacteriaceae bacterium]
MRPVIGSLVKNLVLCLMLLMLARYNAAAAGQKEKKAMMVRISEIEVGANDLAAYKAILQEEAAASIRLEPGVVAIFPMYQKDRPTEIRILEIYANHAAYESHLKTPHFQKYKTTTLHMVRSLKLIDMGAIDAATMTQIFKKMSD